MKTESIVSYPVKADTTKKDLRNSEGLFLNLVHGFTQIYFFFALSFFYE